MRRQAVMSMMQVLEKSVVVFSKNYLPLCKVNMKRAVVLLITKKAWTLDIKTESVWHISSRNLAVYVPKHIRSRERMWKVLQVNLCGISRRDHHSFQDCGIKKNLTLDCVILGSRGGCDTWDNVEVPCSKCNSRKSDRRPKEPGMQLRTKPKAPVHPTIYFAEKFWKGDAQANLE